MKTAMRVFFCIAPALVIGGLAALAHIAIGAAVFAGVTWLGWEVTEPHPERGES